MSEHHEESSNFDRILSQKDVVALAFGAMIGWGWVVLSGEWITTAGAVGAAIAFLIGGFMIFFVALTYAELTAALPKCGGEHVFSLRALGWNASYICTWAIILGYVSVVSFEAVAFPTVLQYLFPNYVQGYMYTVAGFDIYGTWVAVGVVGSIIITIFNYVGVKPAAFLQGVLVFAIAAVGIIFMLGAFTNGETANMQPLFIDGMSGIMKVAVMTPFMFVGFDVIPQAAEEIDMPFQKLGKILLFSVFLGILWYVMIILGTARALPFEQTAASPLAAADAMKAVYFNSNIASTLMIIAGIGGILTSWNSFFVGGSRAMYSMAESGMLPEFLAKLHPKYKTPTNAVLLIGLVSCIAPFFGRSMLVWLSNAGSSTIVVSYMLVSISFLTLRKKEPNLERPYTVKNGGFVGAMAILCCAAMLVMYLPGMPAALAWPSEWVILILWSLLGAGLSLYKNLSKKKKGTDA